MADQTRNKNVITRLEEKKEEEKGKQEFVASYYTYYQLTSTYKKWCSQSWPTDHHSAICSFPWGDQFRESSVRETLSLQVTGKVTAGRYDGDKDVMGIRI